MLFLFSVKVAECPPVCERAMQFTVHVFPELLSIFVCASFPFGVFEDGFDCLSS